MRETLSLHVEQEALTLITGIAFSRVDSWFGATVRDLKMDIILPKQKARHAPCPAILWFCGGAYKEVNRSLWIPQLMQLARRGYVVASAEYRTSNESPFPAALLDAKSAVRFLKANAKDFCIDPSRICVMGESAGGTMASLVGTTVDCDEFDVGMNLDYSSTVNATVDFYGLMDIKLQEGIFDNNDTTVPAWCMEAFFGPGCKEAEHANAINYVNENTPPFLIFHGSKDPLVPIENSVKLYERLMEKGCDATFYTVEGAGHGEDVFYQTPIIDIIDAFLRRTLM